MSTNPTGKYKPKPHAFDPTDMAVAEDARKLLKEALRNLDDMKARHEDAEAIAKLAKTEPDMNPDFCRALANEGRLSCIEHARQAFALLRTISPRTKK